MEASSPASEVNLPDGVQQDELYDGPRVVPHPATKMTPQLLVAPIQEVPPSSPQVSFPEPAKDGYPAAVLLALDVLSARLLGLVALVTGCVIWAYVVYDPNQWRIIAAVAFSITVFLPIMVIYWKAGMAGEGE
jgi:hypothetical protein